MSSSSSISSSSKTSEKVLLMRAFLTNIADNIADENDTEAIQLLNGLVDAYEKKNAQCAALAQKRREKNLAKGLTAEGKKRASDRTDEEILAKAKETMLKREATRKKKAEASEK